MARFGTTSSHQTSVRLRDLWQRLRTPVPTTARASLDAAWARVDPQFRTPNQMFGRHEEGCGATIGVMPRCDFACRGCYLNDTANTTPALSVAAVQSQMDVLRSHLGPWGNVQLTDGEVSLRNTDEVIEILQYARQILCHACQRRAAILRTWNRPSRGLHDAVPARRFSRIPHLAGRSFRDQPARAGR